LSGKFRNRFRISSSRASWWDYGNGSYFVTICTRNRAHFFGEILDNVFYPAPIGNVAENFWREIPDRFPYARLGEHVIMPNHVHGIVIIRRRFDPDNISKSHRGGITRLHNPLLHQNLSRVIRWYTGRVSYESHKINPEFNWQRRFNDRIIRDINEYKTKTRYIQNNISNWQEDEFY